MTMYMQVYIRWGNLLSNCRPIVLVDVYDLHDYQLFSVAINALQTMITSAHSNATLLKYFAYL